MLAQLVSKIVNLALVGYYFTNVAIAGDFCTPKIDPTNPRRVNIKFEDKTISIIGHRHPMRSADDSFENYLNQLLIGANEIDSSAITAEINRHLEKDKKAIMHWKQDLRTIETLVSKKETSNIFIEFEKETFQNLRNTNRYFYRLGQAIFKNFGYSEEKIEEILIVAITPAFYLQNLKPHLFDRVQIGTVEPTEDQISEYNRTYCPAEETNSAVPNEKIAALNNLVTSLTSRGVPQSDMTERFEKGNQAVIAISKDKKFFSSPDSQSLVNAFISASGLQLNEYELGQLFNFLRVDSEILKETDSHIDEYIKNLPQNISQYKGCWGRDSLIARSLAQAKGNQSSLLGLAI